MTLLQQHLARVTNLSLANVWLVATNGVWFGLVTTVLVILPGRFVLQKLHIKLGLFNVALSFMVGNLYLFLWRYLAVALGWGEVGFLVGAVLVAGLAYWGGAVTALREDIKNWRRSHLWLLVFFLLMPLDWTLPTLATGLVDKNDGVIMSMWLGGERLMMTGHATTIFEQVPPIHPYWQNIWLQYHYFGTVLQTAYHSLGLNPLLINFMLLPTAIGLAVGLAIYVLTRCLTQNRFVSLMAVVIFFWWDTLGYLFPVAYRYEPTRWWMTVFTDHKHAYINGNSHQFAALFLLLALVLFWQALMQPKIRAKQLTYVLAGAAAGILILMKAQAFMAFVGGVIIYLILEIMVSLIGRQRTVTKTLGAVWWLLVGVLSTGLPLIWHNRAQLFIPKEINVMFSPLSHPVGALDNVPAIHQYIEQASPGIIAQLRFWRDYNLPPSLVHYFWYISLGFMLVAISFKVIGLLAPLFARSLTAAQRSLVLLLFSVSVSAILATLLLWFTLGNQWQFLFTAFIPLSILTAFVISRWSYPKVWLIVLTLISLPTGLGVLADVPVDRSLPQAEINSVAQIRRLRARFDSCFFVLPPNTEDPNSPVDLYNQVREIMYPFYAHCRVNAAMGPKPILNFAVKDTEQIYKVLKPDLLAVTDAVTLGAYLEKYQPRWLWLAPNNRYGATVENMLSYGYQPVAGVSQTGGQILERR
ncbi:MAG: hypothetical protein Q7S64_03140 [bacterium]|nr:hypothetical protein [bacterium]